MKKKDRKTMKKPVFDRPVERYFYKLDNLIAPQRRAFYAVFLTLLFFGVLGLIWMIPFPQLAFLERMHAQTFLNWASFYIAIVIYLYLRLAPTLSYAMLFSIGVMSFVIVQLEYAEKAGGPAVWLVALIAACIGLIGLLFLSKRETPPLHGKDLWKLITIGPVWLWTKVFEQLKLKY